MTRIMGGYNEKAIEVFKGLAPADCLTCDAANYVQDDIFDVSGVDVHDPVPVFKIDATDRSGGHRILGMCPRCLLRLRAAIDEAIFRMEEEDVVGSASRANFQRSDDHRTTQDRTDAYPTESEGDATGADGDSAGFCAPNR